MKNIMRSITTVKMMLTVCLFVTNCVVAQPHGAHTHGEAEMSVIFNGEILLLELETPAANILGFEYKPQNDTQKNRLTKAISDLNDPEMLFSISSSCKLKTKDVEAPFSENESIGKGEKSHAKGDIHHHAKDDHEGHETQEEKHHDFHLRYQWQCPDVDKLAIKVRLFEVFSRFEKIHTQWVAFDRQGAALLDKNNVVMELAR